MNIGWHAKMMEFNGGAQIITDGVTLGEGGDYASLDAMASDLVNAKLPQQFRNDPRLVVLVGADLVAAEQYRLYQKADRPTEKIAAQMLGSTIAGRPAVVPPFMPGKRMVVTPLKTFISTRSVIHASVKRSLLKTVPSTKTSICVMKVMPSKSRRFMPPLMSLP